MTKWIVLLLLLLASPAQGKEYVPFPPDWKHMEHNNGPRDIRQLRHNSVHHSNFRHRHEQPIHSNAHARREKNHAPYTARNPVGPIVAVETAANITIRVADSLATQFKGFIKDLVEDGYTPKRINCFASSGHVTFSRHYVGAACDFDQRCWGCTVPQMHRVSALTKKWGLRDGCSFGDCGHIDDGKIPSKVAAKHWPVTLHENSN